MAQQRSLADSSVSTKANLLKLRSALDSITSDPDYLKNQDWGKPRRGHPEGTIGAHIKELLDNLAAISSDLTAEQSLKIEILIHAHDTMKPQAQKGARIMDPHSHASLARALVGKYLDDGDLLQMVQLHDEPYALWRQSQGRGMDLTRLDYMLSSISDWDTFFAFVVVDGMTQGKSAEPVKWAIRSLSPQVNTALPHADFIDRIEKINSKIKVDG